MDTTPPPANASNSTSSQPRKNWSEMRQMVRQVRCQLYSTASRVPSNVAFRSITDERGLPAMRLYFLSSLASGREITLHYADVSEAHETSEDGGAQRRVSSWKPLLESKFHAVHHFGRLSREEQLHWERKRLMMWGITSFDHLDGMFVFPAGGSVFYCDDSGEKEPPHFPQELRSSLTSARLNPQLCPCNPNLVAFVSNGDIWVHHIPSGCEVRLTHTRKGGTSLSDNPISAGIPPYVTQEEFSRYVGFWWCPTKSTGDSRYRMLYEVVDESEVEILHLPSFGEDCGVEEYRFPRAGTLNARSTLKIAEFAVNDAGLVENIVLLSTLEPLSSVCSISEYILRAGWTPNGKLVWTEVLDRQQKHLQLAVLPVSAFHVDEDNNRSYPPLLTGAGDISPQVIWEEVSDVWINVHDILYFFPTEDPNVLTFLWASEESGFRHLYLISLKLQGDTTTLGCSKGSDRVLAKTQLTSGDWEVSERDVWVDEVRRLVYFIGLKDTPLERHLYVVNLDNPNHVSRLTPAGFSHTVFMNSDHTSFVTVQSNISHPPFSQIFELKYNEDTSMPSSHHIGFLLESASVGSAYLLPQLFSHQLSSGHEVYGMIFKSPALDPERKYPTVLTIYGGPEVQLVTNTFKGMRHLRQHLLASANYIVVVVDCRGSRHRGVEFESHIKGRMGTVEIADHVEVLQWLADTTGYIDINRIGIHGWSYGGYLTLMGLAQRPDIFKVAVAGAPVTSWNLYDTGYTERYMDTPANNVSGYLKGSVLAYVNQFPTEQNRLLIVHGLMDENVHFTHTSQLVSALVKAGKPYQLQVYPTERHSLRHLDTSEHYETMLLSFLQDHL
ncbi:dipeptidyl peptidase 9-like [Ornithodoros turicata]|uniref:dipeptidyl peptidase 9-like n=1 Tax=Ornithodoros turicata TaxID=34597 RepID=UPI003138689A